MRIGIVGYGNLGRGVESAIRQNADMELVAVFTRRSPESVKIRTEGVPVLHTDEALKMKDLSIKSTKRNAKPLKTQNVKKAKQQ